MEITTKYLCVVGDIHGEIQHLVWDACMCKDLRDTTFIVAGDFGLGFHKLGYYDREYYRASLRLEKCNNYIYGLRGNHDNPDFYDPESKNFIDYPRLKALPDYTRLTWGSREILVIGGAQSKDATERKQDLKKYPWWSGERIVRDLGKIKDKEDIIISHEAPISLGPPPYRSDSMTLEDYRGIIEDREYLNEVLISSRPQRYYFGHYHKSYSGNWGETLWKGLDINEIIEVRQ